MGKTINLDFLINIFFPQSQKEDGPLYRFYEAIMDTEVGRQFIESIKRMRDVTLFAPSNNAWQDDNLKNVLRNEDKMREILNMHLVRDQRLSVEKIKQNNINQVSRKIFKESFIIYLREPCFIKFLKIVLALFNIPVT